MISIITPAWNRSDLTHRWLSQNWVKHLHRNVEWIVIDNGSIDDTWKVLKYHENKMNGALKIISLNENTGFGPANNRGAEIAQGDILAFISNDVQVLGDYITPIEILYNYSQGQTLFGPEIWGSDTGWNTFDLGTIPYVAGWCVIIEAALWGPLCQWDERFVPCDYEDIDLSYQVTRGGGQIDQVIIATSTR